MGLFGPKGAFLWAYLGQLMDQSPHLFSSRAPSIMANNHLEELAEAAKTTEKQKKMIPYLRTCRNLTIRLKLVSENDVFFIRRFLHNGPDTVDELLDRHVVKKEKSLNDEEDELLTRQRLTSSRREALSLYRDILRATRFFMWPDSQGIVWRDILRENARKEFEEARFEKDPEIVTRLLIGGRQAVESALEKLAEKQRQQIEKDRGGGNGQ